MGRLEVNLLQGVKLRDTQTFGELSGPSVQPSGHAGMQGHVPLYQPRFIAVAVFKPSLAATL